MIRSTQRHFATAALGVALSVLSGCGGGGDSTGPGTGGGNGTFRFTAKVDGVAWASETGAERIGVPTSVAGLYSLVGIKVGGANGYTIVIALYNIRGPGTYPLGVGPQVVGGSAQISNASGGWSTPLTGADGSITITTLTASRIEGTFNFTANALTGTATGTKTVTDGSFVLEVKPTGTIGAVPDNVGSKVSATLNAVPFNAAAAGGSYTTTNNILSVVGNNNTRSVAVTLAGVPGTGTYALATTSPTRTLGVTITNGAQFSSWSSAIAGSSGSVTITSMTATRIAGTFTATLSPVPGTQATGTMTITNGVFDIGRQ